MKELLTATALGIVPVAVVTIWLAYMVGMVSAVA